MKKLYIVAGCIVVGIKMLTMPSCVVRKSEPITQKQFIAADDVLKKGEKHYMHHCQKCHPAGEAGLGPSITANPAPMFLKRFQVRHGLGVMPSFKSDELSKEDLQAIASYLKAWKRY